MSGLCDFRGIRAGFNPDLAIAPQKRAIHRDSNKPCEHLLSARMQTAFPCISKPHSLFKNIGIVVAPLHLEVWTIFSPTSSASARVTIGGSLLDKVDTFPPERMRRRFVPTGPGNLKPPVAADAMVMMKNQRQ